MGPARETLQRLERAAVGSWPAPETADIDGWHWRYASGGSLRANSVSTLAFTGSDLEQAIGAAERRYHARGALSRFTVTAVSEPADLDARLAARGYALGKDHVTMLKEVAALSSGAEDVVRTQNLTPQWLAIYLAGLAPERALVAPRILARLPHRRMFFAFHRFGEVVGSGLSVVDGDLASVQCMATRSDARRRGCARAILSAIEAWASAQGATHLYLQAELANVSAIALYEGFGFRVAGAYHVRFKG
jgi:ribosomal protein S18 acetylase RimI-like enzyme